jgi:hypothetical protein
VSLFEQLVENQESHRQADTCTVAKIRWELNDVDAADLDRALSERSGGTWLLTGVSIAASLQKVLGEKAYGIKGPTVQRHRRGLCSCTGSDQ